MKLVLAAVLLATAAVSASTAPASAESSYWEQRSRDGGSEYRQSDRRGVVHRRAAKADERRVMRRRHFERDARVSDVVPNPFRVERNDGRAYPTMNNDYWLQSSIYDFQDGKPADLKKYRY